MRVIRLCKTALVGSVALLFTLFAFGNVTDYDSNWIFVRHVMSMDTVIPDSTLHWRAISDPTLQTAAYWIIIVWQAAIAAVLWVGVAQLFAASSSRGFAQAKSVAVVGLTAGILLLLVPFIAIGGEWFAMWQSSTWNSQNEAFQLTITIGIVLIVLLLPEKDEDAP